jgi:hypothetical protein
MHTDCDRTKAGACGLTDESLKALLARSVEQETEMLRTYTIAAERVQDDEPLKERLRNFAEGNAKRSRQLMDELQRLQ